MDRSAAARLVTGAVNFTTTGCATPTIAPLAGKTEATPGSGSGTGTAATLRVPDPNTPMLVIATITNR